MGRIALLIVLFWATHIPEGVSQYIIPIRQISVFTLNGYKQVDGYRLFDRDINTRFSENWSSDWRSGDVYPLDVWVVLDSIYHISKTSYYLNHTNGTTFSLFYYDKDRRQVGDSVIIRVSGGGWETIKGGRQNVRFLRVKAYSTFASNDGLWDISIEGRAIARARSIFPTTPPGSATDWGEVAHGMNYIGDRFDKLDLQGDTIVTKLAKSVRWYETGSDFDFFPDTYYSRLIDGPLYIGRHGYNSFGNLVGKLKYRGLKPMFLKTGGTMKWIADTNEVNNNYKWQGLSGTSDLRYIEPGADPEMDSSWAPLAEQYYRLISLYGSNPNAKKSGTVIGGDTTKGQNSIEIFEWDNEASRWWVRSYYHSPKAYYEAIKKVWTRGKQADPHARIYAAALPGIDTSFWRAVFFWHYLSNGDVNNFPADGFNFNMYLNNYKADQGYNVNTSAISPERWRIVEEMALLKSFFNRMFPGKAVQWTEYGFATDDVSPYDVDAIGEKSDRQVQADFTLRLKALVQTQRFVERMYYYSFFQDATGPFNSMAVARDSSDYIHVIPYPVGYALGQELLIEKEYNFFSDIIKNGDSTGVWVTEKVHIRDPDRRLYKVWLGSSSGSTLKQYELKVPGATNAKLYTVNYNSFNPDTFQLRVSEKQTVAIPVTESMLWVEINKAKNNTGH
ncbi:MAG TPA: hypothetical protein VLA58_10285 [Chitinophagaceae bacterium]|nr:hypothetical protein [Chitinophagaceae bacterium]